MAAQTSAGGRARLALAMAFLNVSPWAPGAKMPPPDAYRLQETGQYAVEFGGSFNTMDFVEFARYYLEQAAGGNGSWTAGVNFAKLLDQSPYAAQVRDLYQRAGLSLRADLTELTHDANITADANAIQWLQQTSVPTGQLLVPELDMHTIADQLVPVQQENDYAQTVRSAGANALLRQAFVQRQQHCNFTPAELVAGVLALRHRVDTGTWGAVATPEQLEHTARTLDLGDAAFIRYQPQRLSGNNGPFNHKIDATTG